MEEARNPRKPNQRQLEIDQEISRLTEELHEEEQQKLYGKGVGCGTEMNFDLLPRPKEIEKILMEWYAVNDISDIDVQGSMTDKKIQ